MRRPGLLAGLILALAVAAPVAAAGGDHTQSFTDTFHGYQTDTQVNPCNGDTVNISETSSVVNHVTYFPASDEVWGTFTEEDSQSAYDVGTGVTYVGHATFWGNINLNRQNANSTFTRDDPGDRVRRQHDPLPRDRALHHAAERRRLGLY